MSLNNIANLYESRARYAEAETLYTRGLAIWEKAHGLEHPTVAFSLTNLAILYQDQGRYTGELGQSRKRLLRPRSFRRGGAITRARAANSREESGARSSIEERHARSALRSSRIIPSDELFIRRGVPGRPWAETAVAQHGPTVLLAGDAADIEPAGLVGNDHRTIGFIKATQKRAGRVRCRWSLSDRAS
jgi:hypothetical protein